MVRFRVTISTRLALVLAGFVLSSALAACSSPSLAPTIERASNRTRDDGSMTVSDGTASCDDGSTSDKTTGLCADGSLPQFPPVQAQPSNPCASNYYFAGYQYQSGSLAGVECAPIGWGECLVCGGSVRPPPFYGLCNPVTGQGYCPTPGPNSNKNIPASQRIVAYAIMMEGFSTRNIPGTRQGRVACAYMVNRILQNTLGRGYGTGYSVPSMVEALDADTANVVPLGTSAASAGPGDIVVMDGADYAHANDLNSPAQSHVGICLNVGCSQIASNSTGSREFMNNYHDSNMGLPPSEPSTFYHIKQ